MKKIYLSISVFASILFINGCSYRLDFEPVKLYKFSALPKEWMDENVVSLEPVIKLFTNYLDMYNYFNNNTYYYGEGNRDEAFKNILSNVDFELHNIFAYMRYEGTGSTFHAIELNNNLITMHSYTPNVITDDIAYKWFVFEVDNKYSLDEFTIEYKKLTSEGRDYLIDNFSEDYWF